MRNGSKSGGHMHSFAMYDKKLSNEELAKLKENLHGGLLSPVQADAFVKNLIAQPTILQSVKVVKMGAPDMVVKVVKKPATEETDPELVPLSEMLKDAVSDGEVVGGEVEPPPWAMVSDAKPFVPATKGVTMMEALEEKALEHEQELQEGVAKVIIKMPDGTEKELDEKVSPFIGKGQLANVGVVMAFTKNMGNYENVKVSVSLHLPCLPTEIDTVFPFVQEWVDDRLTEVRGDIDSAVKGEKETG